MSILITGGAGYIGSCTTYKLIQKYNYPCIIVDKQETVNLRKIQVLFPNMVNFYKIDMTNYNFLEEVFQNHKIEMVIHFAAYTLVNESEYKPYKYLYNNVNSTLNLLELMKKYEVKNLIFSSSASVYGKALYIPIDEDHPLNPESTYALSKKICEEMIFKYSSKGINFISLRYFNPAGAVDFLGEEHDPETHLLPILVQSIMKGQVFRIYGNDFPTPDGTCIRDFIHIEDLVEAHLLAIEKIESLSNEFLNVGINKGYSVLQVLNTALELFKNKINPKFKYIFVDRREGDVPILVAKADKIKQKLSFSPKYDLEDILLSVWNYESQKISI